LGECSPLGPNDQGDIFSLKKKRINFQKKWTGLHFGQIYLPQTHLVTLVSSLAVKP
jgi:hypothetical protein